MIKLPLIFTVIITLKSFTLGSVQKGSFHVGRIREGQMEYDKLNGRFSIEQAQSICDKDPTCGGFTFKGPKDSQEKHFIYFFHLLVNYESDASSLSWSTYKPSRQFILINAIPRDALDIFKNLEGKSKKIPQIFDDIEITRRKCINLRKKCAGIGSSLETGKSFILQRVNLDELVKSEKYETELRLELPRTMEEDGRFSGFDAYKNINRCCPQVEADSVSLEKLAEGFQKDGDIHRIPCNIGAETFRDSFIRFNSPSILEGCTKDWKAKDWTVKGLLEIEDGEKDWITNFATKNGDVVDIQEQGKPRRGKEVLEMLKNNSVIRIFDPLAERTSRLRKETNSSTPSDKLELMSHYKVPWSIPEDLFKSCGVLTDYQWIAISSSNTGTDLHLDPVLTSAWNTLLAGRKLWVVLPKDIEINPLSCDPSCSYQQDLSSVSWFQHILPQIRDRKWYGQRILKFIQYTGDTLYIPSRAGHAVLNIDETIAVTENFLSIDGLDDYPNHLLFGGRLLPDLEEKDDGKVESDIWSCLESMITGKDRSKLCQMIEQIEQSIEKKPQICKRHNYGRNWLTHLEMENNWNRKTYSN